ncbi:SARP family transcriptional regulator [Microtetraspora sp. NBRC 13810]|uniref:AfsR/SARP family transcriptional regulator n=1 Tax=Microtetraspora sp. NBRC 13810 TaxID=3030990 RepID=UPI0024A350A9|nr:SARP family transcriptional regulator [Microtetraspora sp. NBRC 13810]
MLTALLLDPGRVVPADRLIEAVWGEDPPPTARAVLQTYVASLRRAFESAGMAEVIVSHRVGYLAEVPADAIDRNVFERHVAEGRQAAREKRLREASDSFHAALALWRGPALGGIGDSFLHAEATRLDELRLTVVEERVTADLAVGRDERLIEELTELVALHPARERLRRDFMVALYRAGRQADALAVFRQGREVLIEELGIEPGPELREAHELILRSDPSLLKPAAATPPAPTPAPAATSTSTGGGTGPVRQLPPPLPDFTGRDAEATALRDRLTEAGTMPICVISGPGGAGKSALALHTAHAITESYPDGQLHVELRGTTEAPATPEEVLGRLLRELEPSTAPLPATLEERAGRFRSLLAGRRKLVVLEDALSERQVRPLLPGTPGCGVIVTSRNRLAGLAGAAFVDLGVLPQPDAVALLARIAGPERIVPDSETARRIVRQCGGLPLALRIAGARLASRRHWSAERLAERLADEQRRLDELAVGDQEVRASISLSYELLPEPAKVALRRLGLLGLPYFSVWVAAAATETDLDEAEDMLEQLVDASLVGVEGVDVTGQIRYRLHDLIRLFARERAAQEESEHERTATVTRVLGGWLWLIERLSKAAPTGWIPLLSGFRLARPVDPEVERVVLADPHGWFRAEEEALIVAVELAAAMDLDEIAVELASALSYAFEGNQYVSDNPFAAWNRTHEAALAAARRNDNAIGEATLLAGLGQLYYERDLYAESREYLTQALSMFRSAKDVRGEATTLAALGVACREQGYLPESLHFLDRADALWAGQGDRAATAHVRRIAGSVRLEQGDYPQAWADLNAALLLYREEGSRRGEALTLRSISMYHRAKGELDSAERTAVQARDICAAIGDRLLEAYCTRSLAKVRLRLGRHDEARGPLQDALAVARDLSDRFGEACSLRTLGELDLAEGRLYQAKSHLEQSLELWDALRSALFRARVLRDLAQVHQALGDAATAEKTRAEAMEIFRLHGSREYGEPPPL